jgi:deoxyadenosine/deoxycytidine kinase
MQARQSLGDDKRIALMNVMKQGCLRVSLQGNIGAGKSSVLAELARHGHATRQEAVDSWTVLPLFYSNPARYAFALQTQILASCATHDGACTLITERSACASIHIFANMLLRQGHLTPSQFALLSSVHDALPLAPPTIVVFLDVAVEQCHARIMQRGRASEENGVSLDYLQDLSNQHAVYLQDCRDRGITVLTVECGDLPVSAVADRVESTLAQVLLK